MTRKKILVVDDQSQIRRLINITLGSEYEIVEAKSGVEAVEKAEHETPSLIIIDVMMPGEFDGLEAVKRIRKLDNGKEVYILMLTAMGQDTGEKAGLSAGANDYFNKPFSPTALMKKVEEVVG